MTRKEKAEKKKRISESINLGRGRFTDSEVDTLLSLVTDPEKYNGQSRKRKNSFTGWSSDGRYTGTEESVFTIEADEESFRIQEEYQYHDTDGEYRERNTIYDTARDILKLLDDLF